MALRKISSTHYGIDATYYLVARVTTDKIAQTGSITMYGYPSRQARFTPNCTPIDIQTITVYPIKYPDYFSIEDLGDDTKDNQYRQAYKYIKENEPFFIESIDLMEDQIKSDTSNIEIPTRDVDELNSYEDEYDYSFENDSTIQNDIDDIGFDTTLDSKQTI